MLYTSTEDGKGAVVAVSIILMVVGFITTYAISAYHHWCCEFKSRSEWGVQHYVIIDRWFSLGPPVSSTNKTDRHKITEILLKVALSTIKQTNKQTEVERKNLGFFFFLLILVLKKRKSSVALYLGMQIILFAMESRQAFKNVAIYTYRFVYFFKFFLYLLQLKIIHTQNFQNREKIVFVFDIKSLSRLSTI